MKYSIHITADLGGFESTVAAMQGAAKHIIALEKAGFNMGHISVQHEYEPVLGQPPRREGLAAVLADTPAEIVEVNHADCVSGDEAIAEIEKVVDNSHSLIDDKEAKKAAAAKKRKDAAAKKKADKDSAGKVPDDMPKFPEPASADMTHPDQKVWVAQLQKSIADNECTSNDVSVCLRLHAAVHTLAVSKELIAQMGYKKPSDVPEEKATAFVMLFFNNVLVPADVDSEDEEEF